MYSWLPHLFLREESSFINIAAKDMVLDFNEKRNNL